MIRRLTVVAAAMTLAASSQALAQSASHKAAAEALFQEAVDLMEQGQQTEACAKYQASQELDPALGTLLRLADCYDRTGKTASAWALFVEAEVVANRSEQGERANMARERSQDLKQRLSTLTLDVQVARVAGLSVWVNGTEIPPASWGTPLPIDPGPVTLEAKAAGFKTWSTELELETGPAQRTYRLPMLQREAVAPRSPQASTEVMAPKQTPTQDQEPASSAQSTWGYVVGTAGALGLVGAGLLTFRAYSLNQDSLDQCAADNPNACTEDGKDLRDQATRYGSAATIASGVGGGLLLTGLVLVLSAPSDEAEASQTKRLSVVAGAGPEGGAVTLRGVW